MEYGSIERELHVDASPEVVFDVVSSPAHLREWWPDDASLDPVPGGTGTLTFDHGGPEPHVAHVTVVEAEPHRLFSFRWCYDAGVTAAAGNSLLVTFELTPADGGTHLRMTETGFRERGWEIAVLEQQYAEHVQGWGHFLPRLPAYVTRLTAHA